MSAQQPALLYPAAEGSGPIVLAAYQTWSTTAQQAFAQAQQLTQQLANLPLSPVNFNANFSPQLALSGFPTITPPASPTTLDYVAPAVPALPSFISVPIVPPPAYVDQMLGTLQNAISAILATGHVLPPDVAQQLRDRANTDAYAEELRAVQNATSDFAARGFYVPGGVLQSTISDARTDARKKRQMTNRDVYIQDQLVAVENVKFAITSGIQMEQVSVEVYRAQIQLMIQSEQVAVEAARLQVTEYQAQVELFNAQLQGAVAKMDANYKLFEAQVQLYQANAQVATAAGAYDERRFQLNMAQEQATVETEMKRQDQSFEQMRYLTSVALEIKKTIATIAAQLASAAMSAVNIGASLSSSTSESVGYSLGVDFSGSMDSSS